MKTKNINLKKLKILLNAVDDSILEKFIISSSVKKEDMSEGKFELICEEKNIPKSSELFSFFDTEIYQALVLNILKPLNKK